MPPAGPDRWTQIRGRKLADPAARERYERTRRTVVSTREVLRRINVERERAGLTKAELARRVGARPAAVRRLLTSDASNPTLRTLLEMFDALGLEVTVRPKARPRRKQASKSPSVSNGQALSA